MSTFSWEEPTNSGINWKPLDRLGAYNQMPEPYTEITEQEFLDYTVTENYGLKSINHRQVYNLGLKPKSGRWLTNPYWTVKFFNYHDRTIALAYRYMRLKEAKNMTGYIHAMYPDDSYVHFTRYYKIGCEHKTHEMTSEEARKAGYDIGPFMHHVICTKCGYKYSYDSSG